MIHKMKKSSTFYFANTQLCVAFMKVWNVFKIEKNIRYGFHYQGTSWNNKRERRQGKTRKEKGKEKGREGVGKRLEEEGEKRKGRWGGGGSKDKNLYVS